MDRFSLEILERTVELAVEAMPPEENPRIVACVTAIRDYIESPHPAYEKTVSAAVIELSEIARMNSYFLIAARLAPIAQQLSGMASRAG